MIRPEKTITWVPTWRVLAVKGYHQLQQISSCAFAHDSLDQHQNLGSLRSDENYTERDEYGLLGSSFLHGSRGSPPGRHPNLGSPRSDRNYPERDEYGLLESSFLHGVTMTFLTESHQPPKHLELPIYPVPLLLFPRPWLGAKSAQGSASSPCI